MADEPLLVVVPKENIDKLTKLADAVEKFIDCSAESRRSLTIPDLPKTVTMADIKEYYGIGKDKWRSGVKAGRFPQPLEGFDKPKRWNLAEVEASLSKGVT